MQKSTQEKLNRINQLQKEIAERQEELEGLLNPEKTVVLPSNFSMNNETLEVIKQAGESGIELQKILKTLQEKYPKYGIDRKKVASALAYLKNWKKSITDIRRGVYKIL